MLYWNNKLFFLLTQWMLDVTDKGTINQVLTYSNSANANGFIEAFEIFWNLLERDWYRDIQYFRIYYLCKIVPFCVFFHYIHYFCQTLIAIGGNIEHLEHWYSTKRSVTSIYFDLYKFVLNIADSNATSVWNVELVVVCVF